MNQKTIRREGSVSGVGLHTGEKSSVSFKPLPPNSGIRFYKDGLKVDSSSEDGLSFRCTSVGFGKNRILTVEHLLASLAGLGIYNIQADVTGPELPGLDGSALPFVKLFLKLGLEDQNEPREVFKIMEPIFCYESNKALSVYPSEEFRVSYILDYDHPVLRDQQVDFLITPQVFEKEIAPARTFCTKEEADRLKKDNLGKGASYENTLVISEDGPIKNTFRFRDECARHKVLDLLGDLNLMDFSIAGRVIGLRSGHSLNRKLVEEIKKQREGAMESKKKSKDVLKNSELDVEAIKKILPHRYPFLLVDRILEMGEKTIVGIKNVTTSEPFFQGHFPDRPVMPGVLMVEAIAQVAGVFLLSKPENRGKLAYLASITNARFRRLVVPGDQLRIEVAILKLKSRFGMAHGVAKVDGETACDVEFMFSLAD